MIVMLKTQLVRNYGHPWDTRRKGFDVLFVYSDNYKEVSDYSIAAQKKFWASWMIGNVKNVDGVFVGVLYKPSGIMHEWSDSPEKPYKAD